MGVIQCSRLSLQVVQVVTVYAPTPSPECTVLIPAAIYTYQVTTQWVPFAMADRCLLNGLLLQSCRKIAALPGHPLANYCQKIALRYKIACIGLLRPLISFVVTTPSDTLIAASLFLALDEVGHSYALPIAHRGIISLPQASWTNKT